MIQFYLYGMTVFNCCQGLSYSIEMFKYINSMDFPLSVTETSSNLPKSLSCFSGAHSRSLIS